MIKTIIPNIHRYLAITPRDKEWGSYVTAAGAHNVPPGQESFADVTGHHLWKKRRVLKDYGIIYLTRGHGVFKSADTPQMRLAAGDVLLLFPDVWHRYRPDSATGWQEHWLLFNGSQIDRLRESQIISSKSPVFHVGVGGRIEELFHEVITSVQAQPSTPNRILGALVDMILAHVVSAPADTTNGEMKLDEDVMAALTHLEKNAHGDVDMAALAHSLNLSSCTFNRRFRRVTGLTPHHYHTQLRVSRAKELLENPNLKVKQISLKLGFQDQYYFSRMFKKHTGFSPVEWRKTMGRRTT